MDVSHWHGLVRSPQRSSTPKSADSPQVGRFRPGNPVFRDLDFGDVPWRRVAEAVARLSSHGTGLVLFTYGSSGRRGYDSPGIGRFTTS